MATGVLKTLVKQDESNYWISPVATGLLWSNNLD